MGKTKSPKGKASKRPNGKVGTADAFEILTLDEAAVLLRVSASGLLADAERGSVPGRLIGGEWRFARQVLWAWVTSPPISTPNAPKRILVDLPSPDETDHEYEMYMEAIRKSRDEVDRQHRCGAYAVDE